MNEMYEELVTEIRSWQLCRICAEQSEDLINIYDERGISMQLEEKINHYLPITVTADDDLPLFMCYSCITKLNTVHELIVSCVQSNDRFNQLLQMEQKLALTEIKANDQNEWILLDIEPAYEKFEENDAGVANHRSEVIHNCTSKDSIKIKVNSTEFKLACSVATQTERILRKTIKTASRNDKSRTVNHTSYTECEKKTPIVYCDTDNSDKCSKITEFECERLEYLNRETVCYNIKEQTSSPYEVVQNTDNVKNNNEDTHIKDDAICNAKDIQNFVEHTSPNCAKSYAENKVLGIVVQNQHLSNISGSLESNAKDLSNNIFNKSEHFTELGKHKCKVCGVLYVNDVELKGHNCNGNDNNRPILCNHCGQHFTSENLLRMHKLSHRDTKVWHCDYENCRKVFLHRSNLDIHKTTHTSERPYLCDVCGKCFTHVSHLNSHKRSHLDEISKNKHKCELCGKGLRSVSRLRDHMRFHTGERPFSCDFCPKQFRTKDKLKQHVAIHGNIRPFKCSICSFSSVRRGNLSKHLKTHSRLARHSHHCTSSDGKLKKNKNRATISSDFQCSECGKFLSTKASLEMHERMHAGIKPFLCTECGKQFSQKPALEYHKRTHTGERPYSCKFCGRGFNSKVGKDKHELIHTGEKPYRCNKCDTSFRSRENLHQHKKIHEDSRAFPCPLCDKRFRRREAMKIHMHIHTGERPYSCPICDRSFSQKRDLIKHTRAHSMKTA